jgi:hypothetical protein
MSPRVTRHPPPNGRRTEREPGEDDVELDPDTGKRRELIAVAVELLGLEVQAA